MARLTTKRLRAIEAALNAGLAGEEGEGDLAHVSFDDMEGALQWAQHQLSKRAALTEQPRTSESGHAQPR